jgi:TonB family protein
MIRVAPRRRLARPAILLFVIAGASAAHADGPSRSVDSVEAARLDRPPKQIKSAQPDYPRDALARGLEAEVILVLDVDARGKVTNASVAQPSAHPGVGFEDAAVAAARRLEFEPAASSGQPVAVQIQYRFRFKPAAPPPAPSPPAAPSPPPSAGPPSPLPRPSVVNLSGRLRERGTRLPLAGVLVTVFRDGEDGPTGFEATSDAVGGFQFVDLAPGRWNVAVDVPGYQTFKTDEEVRAGEATAVVYYLERASYNPLDVMVTARRPQKEVSRSVLAVQEIEKVPGTAGDPLAVVQNLPGIARVPPLSNGGVSAHQIIVRGSAPEDTRIFVEGSEIPLVYHFGGLRSVLPMGVLDSLELIPGNFSPAFGRAIGGIIDVRLKRLAPPRIGGYADVSLLDAGAYLEIPLGNKGGLAVAGRRSYIDAILNAAVPSDAGIGLVTAPRYYDYQLIANYRPTPAHDLRAIFFGSDDRLELLFRNPADFDPLIAGNRFASSDAFYSGQVGHRFVPSDKVENTLRISFGRHREHDAFGQLLIDFTRRIGQLRDTVRYKLGERLTLAAGADVYVEQGRGHIRVPPLPAEGEPASGFDLSRVTEVRIDGRWDVSPAGYVEAEVRPLPRWLVLPGLRVDRFPLGRETVAQPRLTSRTEISPFVTIKGGIGLFAQDPTAPEVAPVLGNPDLRTERALHSSGGVEVRPWPHLKLDLTLFDKRLWSLVSKTDALVMRDGALVPQVYDNRGEGHVIGAEIVLRHDLNRHFAGWIAYTLSRSLRRDSGQSTDRLFDFDQTHILTAVATYLLPRNWQIGGRFRLVSGNPRTPIVGAVFNAAVDRYDPVFGPVNSARNEAFHQLDLRIDKRWVFKGWMLNVYLDVQNVYNRRSPEGVTYSYDFRQSKVQQGLPILPIVGLRADF